MSERATLVDFVVQGLGRYRDVRRFPFSAGYNVLTCASASAARDWARLLNFVLEPGAAADVVTVPRMKGVSARAGVTIARGASRYRLIRDFDAHTHILSEHDGARYVARASHPDAIAAFLATEVWGQGVLAHPRVVSQALHMEGMSGVGEAELSRLVADYSSTIASRELENREAELAGELERVRADQKSWATLTARRAELDGHHNPAVAQLGEDLPEVRRKLEAYEAARALHQEGTLACERERSAAEELRDALPIRTLHKDPVVMASTALATLSLAWFAIGGGITVGGVLILIVGLLGFAWAGFLSLRQQEERSLLQDRIKAASDEEKALNRSFDLASVEVRTLLRDVGVTDPDALMTMIKDQRKIRSELASSQKALEQVARLGSRAEIDRRADEVEKQLVGVRARLKALGVASISDASALAGQILSAERGLAARTGRAPRSLEDLVTEHSALNETESPEAPASIRDAFQTAATALRTDVPALLALLREAMRKNVMALSGGVVTELDPAGGVRSLRLVCGGQAAALAEIPETFQRAVAVGLHYTLMQYEAKAGCPLFVVAAPWELDRPGREVAASALRALASASQVVHFSWQSEYADRAELVAEV